MSASDRRKKLQDLLRAMEEPSTPAAEGQAPELPPREAEEADGPQIGGRPSGAGGATAAPAETPAPPPPSPGPGTLAGPAFPEVFAAPLPAAPPRPAPAPRVLPSAPKPEIRPPLPGTVPGTMGELLAKQRGPQALIAIEGLLSPISALETWQVVVASFLLFMFTGFAVSASGGGMGARLVFMLGGLALPSALRFLSAALFRAVVIPGVRVRLTSLQWSERQHRAQVDVSLSGDLPLSAGWRHSVRVSLGSRGARAKPLQVSPTAFDDGTKLDLDLLLEAPDRAVDAAIIWVTSPDGRSLALDAQIMRWRDAKCGRCLGEDPACRLCGGSGQVQEAMF